MENYCVKINQIDDETNKLFEIIFSNHNGIKIAQFDLDLDEITKNDYDYSYGVFNELTFENKIEILRHFLLCVKSKTNSTLSFVMSNGIRKIKIIDEFMEFEIGCMTMSCKFVIKINEELINEFTSKIYNIITKS